MTVYRVPCRQRRKGETDTLLFWEGGSLDFFMAACESECEQSSRYRASDNTFLDLICDESVFDLSDAPPGRGVLPSGP